jgi:hypothetical protein
MSDPLSELGAIATSAQTELCARYPEQHASGGTLLLGKRYADPSGGILMLGLNPGGHGDGKFYVERYKEDHLLPGASDEGIRYWRHAHRLFSTGESLLRDMRKATFSFCSPFRTSTWSNLQASKRDALIELSRPVLIKILDDCRPRLVIVAGVASLNALVTIARPRFELGARRDHGGDVRGTYQWRSHDATFDGAPLVVVQIPHLSRANSASKLDACGRWLGKLVGAPE